MEAFTRNFCLLLNDKAIKTPELKEDVDAVRYSNRVKNHIEIDHLRLIENIMKCTSDDKKFFFE
jgi:hypothetical protein